MFKDTWLMKYKRAIDNGSVIVGQEIKTQINQLVDDLEDIESGRSIYEYNTTISDMYISFIENVMPITTSQGFGKTMDLFLWQKAIVEVVYSFKYKLEGFDRFKRVIILVAKKNGKSGLCSALATAELTVGGGGQLLIFGSNDYKQASLIYDSVVDAIQTIDPDRRLLRKNQSEIRNIETLTKGRKISDKSSNNDGYDIDVAYIDEYHEARDASLLKSIEMGMSAKLSPKLFIVSTEGFNQEGGFADLLKESRSILSGEDTSAIAERTVSFLFTQDSIDEVFGENEEMWRKSNPALDDIKSMEYLREQVDQARKSAVERSFVLTKDFNIPQSTSDSWLNIEDYTYVSKGYDLEQFRGRKCVIGVDLSQTTDLSSISFLFMNSEGEKTIHSMSFIPESKLKRSPDLYSGAKYKEWIDAGLMRVSGVNEIDLEDIAGYAYELYKEYKITPVKAGYDQKFAGEFVKSYNKYFGSRASTVIAQNANSLSNSINLLEIDLKSQKLDYNNNPVVSWSLANAALKVNAEGKGLIVKKGGVDSNRVDIVDSIVMAYLMSREHRSEIVFDDGKGGR